MAKKAKPSEPTITRDLHPSGPPASTAAGPCRADYANHRTLHTLAGVTRLNLTIRRCRNPACPAHKKPYRPEAEGSFALPRHEFGLDVIALVGRLRYAEHRSVPEIRTHLVGRKVSVSERDGHQPARPLRRTAGGVAHGRPPAEEAAGRAGTGDPGHRRPATGRRARGAVGDPRLPLAARSCLAKSLLSARQQDLATLLTQVKAMPARCRSPASSPTASTRSARRWPRCSLVCRTNCASSTICVRRPGRFTRRIVMPRRS